MNDQGESRKKKAIEHSKIITTGVLLLSIIVVMFTLVMVWITCDLTPLTILIPSVEAAFCITAKYYYSKAALENQIKLKLTYGDEATGIISGGTWSAQS